MSFLNHRGAPGCSCADWRRRSITELTGHVNGLSGKGGVRRSGGKLHDPRALFKPVYLFKVGPTEDEDARKASRIDGG